MGDATTLLRTWDAGCTLTSRTPPRPDARSRAPLLRPAAHARTHRALAARFPGSLGRCPGGGVRAAAERRGRPGAPGAHARGLLHRGPDARGLLRALRRP